MSETSGSNLLVPKIFLSIGLILIIFSIISNPGPCSSNNFLMCIEPNWFEEMLISICSMVIGIIIFIISLVIGINRSRDYNIYEGMKENQ